MCVMWVWLIKLKEQKLNRIGALPHTAALPFPRNSNSFLLIIPSIPTPPLLIQIAIPFALFIRTTLKLYLQKRKLSIANPVPCNYKP